MTLIVIKGLGTKKNKAKEYGNKKKMESRKGRFSQATIRESKWAKFDEKVFCIVAAWAIRGQTDDIQYLWVSH
mgnify:CR=1 FL=1